jgi:hypothetical protein
VDFISVHAWIIRNVTDNYFRLGRKVRVYKAVAFRPKGQKNNRYCEIWGFKGDEIQVVVFLVVTPCSDITLKMGQHGLPKLHKPQQ